MRWLLIGGALILTLIPPKEAQAQTPVSRPHVLSWSRGELVLAGAFTTTMWIDAAQTREAMRRGYYETNPILGLFPSSTEINLYGIGASVAILGTAAVLPRPARAILLGTVAAWQIRTIVRTAAIGVSVRF